MNKNTHYQIWFVIAAVFAVILLQGVFQQPAHMKTVPYSEFEQDLKSGLITDVLVKPQYVQGTLKGSTDENPKHVIAARVDPELAARLDKYKVPFSGTIENTFLSGLLSWIIPGVIFFLIWMYVIRNAGSAQGGGMMSIGKSKAKVYVETDTRVTFADVAGVDEAKAELAEVVDFLKSPRDHARLGARMPKGVLLVGPPGTGKTLLARAVAGEAGVPFFSINGSEFVEMFVGVGAARVRDLFEQARQRSAAIVFIDELDALGRARSANAFGGSHDEKEQTLNQLLSEMDGFDPQQGIILLAATNRPEILDPALLRAGRFDRQVLVDRPDKIGRVEILKVHIRNVTLEPGIEIEAIAAMTPGFTGADLANLVNEAALLATRRGADAIGLSDFTQAIERIIAGLEKKHRLLNPLERNVVAHHEIGHALVASSIPGTDRVHKVSIIPRGIGALGYTIQRPTEDRYLMTRDELEAKMAVLLGGRAAERIMFDSVSTGAADDLAKATDIARSMITRFGMDDKLGQVTYEAEQSGFLGQTSGQTLLERRYSETTARHIDDAVRALVDQAFDRATKILTEKKDLLDLAAQKLLEKETLSGDELRQILGLGNVVAPSPVPMAEPTSLPVAAASPIRPS